MEQLPTVMNLTETLIARQLYLQTLLTVAHSTYLETIVAFVNWPPEDVVVWLDDQDHLSQRNHPHLSPLLLRRRNQGTAV